MQFWLHICLDQQSLLSPKSYSARGAGVSKGPFENPSACPTLPKAHPTVQSAFLQLGMQKLAQNDTDVCAPSTEWHHAHFPPAFSFSFLSVPLIFQVPKPRWPFLASQICHELSSLRVFAHFVPSTSYTLKYSLPSPHSSLSIHVLNSCSYIRYQQK